ncbi:hypothetical protein [Paracoccus tegillarcae]|uniref:Uncharacterized protein n=1 Tax=Paracoccus tegillarcae TaxID=1529068 RepID=A0A2K9EW34_9RHOB|nr:hypothetical protein [Paracoccus tegillarcae]AUH32252.1 hypothetical protein CUV01_01530 [Paracoccus tegillarcae]
MTDLGFSRRRWAGPRFRINALAARLAKPPRGKLAPLPTNLHLRRDIGLPAERYEPTDRSQLRFPGF